MTHRPDRPAPLARLGSLTLTFVLASALAGASATSLAAQERPLVVLDPGHGGQEVGVTAEGVVEKDLVLEIAFSMGAEFARAGWDVIYTRTTDQPVEWAQRRQIAEDVEADVLIMLHANGDDDPGKRGAEIYVSEENAHSVAFAQRIEDAYRTMGQGAVVEGRPWPFLTSPTVATAMVELLFLSNERDRALLLDPAFQRELGRAMVQAAEGG